MGKQLAIRLIGILVALLPALSLTVRPTEALAAAAPSSSELTASAGPELDPTYKAYGFAFEQYADHERYGSFTAHEIEVLGQVIVAYADRVGRPERLQAMVDGPVRVRKDLHEVVSYTQAGRVIGLGRGAFDLAVTTEANYYTWGAESGDELAQIVFGHEIGHRWIQGLRRESGVDWGTKYGENVWRGERPSRRETWEAAAQVSSEEEAVTNLALAVLGKGYRWTFLHDAPSTDRRQVWVDGWVSDLCQG